MPIAEFISSTTPNATGSTPSWRASGMNTGTITTMLEIVSRAVCITMKNWFTKSRKISRELVHAENSAATL